MGRSGGTRRNRPGFAQVLRDVLIASMNKGQFPVFILGIIVLVAILKMPPADVSKLMFRVLDAAERRWLLGYALSVVLALGWFFHARSQRRLITGEMSRVAEERNRLQGKVLGDRIKSSESDA